MERPEVDHIDGLSPAISIEQKTTSHNPRSTVGTVTEIHDYLRLLFARAGNPLCPTHKESLEGKSASEIVDELFLKYNENESIIILTPLVQKRKGEHKNIIDDVKSRGFLRLRLNNIIYNNSEIKIDSLKIPIKITIHQNSLVHNVDIVLMNLNQDYSHLIAQWEHVRNVMALE